MAAQKKRAKPRKTKLDLVADFLEEHLYDNNETVGSLDANAIKEIIGEADTDEEVAILDFLARGAPVQRIRNVLGIPPVAGDGAASFD